MNYSALIRELGLTDLPLLRTSKCTCTPSAVSIRFGLRNCDQIALLDFVSDLDFQVGQALVDGDQTVRVLDLHLVTVRRRLARDRYLAAKDASTSKSLPSLRARSVAMCGVNLLSYSTIAASLSSPERMRHRRYDRVVMSCESCRPANGGFPRSR